MLTEMLLWLMLVLLGVPLPPPVRELPPLPRRGVPPNAHAQKPRPNRLPVPATSFSKFLQPSGN
jgi:hypothetical protein